MFECMHIHEGGNTLNTYHFTSVYSGWQCADVLLSSRYDLVKNNVRWFEAQMYCQSHYRAKLVMIANRADQLRLQAYLETIEGELLRCLVLCSHKVNSVDQWNGNSLSNEYLQAKLNVVSFSRRLISKCFTQWLNSQSHRHEASEYSRDFSSGINLWMCSCSYTVNNTASLFLASRQFHRIPKESFFQS